MVEFVEGERCKFILTSGDQRLHFKASSLDVKQDWVTALRTAILAKSRTKQPGAKSNIMAVTLSIEKPHPSGQNGGLLQENGWVRDLHVPSPSPSPSPSANDLNAAAAGTKSDFKQVSLCMFVCFFVLCTAKIAQHSKN